MSTTAFGSKTTVTASLRTSFLKTSILPASFHFPSNEAVDVACLTINICHINVYNVISPSALSHPPINLKSISLRATELVALSLNQSIPKLDPQTFPRQQVLYPELIT